MIELIAYLHGRQKWRVKNIPGEKLTRLNYAFAKVKGVELLDHVPNIDRLSDIRKRYPNLKINISIGGWGAEGFSDAVESQQNRQTFAKNIVKFVKHYGFDGIDLDWEYPGSDLAGIKSRPEDASNFLLFLKELRHELLAENKKYVLTAAVGADKEILSALKVDGNYECADYLDFINIMTYDLRGSWTRYTGHQTNLYPYSAPDGELSADQAVQILLANDVPAEKIVIGSAAYSRDWFGFDNVVGKPALNLQAGSEGTHTTPYKKVKALIDSHPENYYWDEEAQAAYYFDGNQYMTFDDEQSMSAKARYALDNHLGGVMLWELSLDPEAELISAAAETIESTEN